MAEQNQAYDNSIYFNKNRDFYIHKHAHNIGKAQKGLSPSQLMSTYAAQKRKALSESKAIFKGNLKASISDKSKAMISEIFDSDSLMTEFNAQIGKKLQEGVSQATIAKGFEVQRGLNISTLAAKIANPTVKEDINAFNNMLTKFNELSQEMVGEKGGYAFALMSNDIQLRGEALTKAMGQHLYAEVQKFIAQNNGTTIDERRLVAAASSINALANSLKDYKVASTGENISKDSVARLLNNIFSTGFQESIGSMIQGVGGMVIDQSLIELTGRDSTHKMAVYKNGKHLKDVGKSTSGKADIKLKDVQFTVTTKASLQSANITMDIGISNKAYVSQYVPTIGGKRSSTFGGGSGGTLKQAFLDLYGQDVRRYTAYNIMAHQNDEGMGLYRAQLNDLILTRELTRIFSARGTSDFAQYMLVNGTIISIWDMIMATSNTMGLSSSEAKDQGSNQPLTLSIEGRGKIIEAGKIEDAIRRVSKVNDLINSATITAHVHANKLINSATGQAYVQY